MIYMFSDSIVHFVLLTAAVKFVSVQSYTRNYFLIETSKTHAFFQLLAANKSFFVSR